MNIKHLLSHAGWTLSASVLIAVFLQLANVLMVRSLGVIGRGEVAAAVLVPTILMYVGQLGLPSAVGYWINTDPSRRDQFLATARSLVLIFSLALMTLNVVISLGFPIAASVANVALAFSIFIPVNMLVAVHSAVVQADMKSRELLLIRLTTPLVYLISLCVLKASDHLDPTSAVMSQLLGSASALAVSGYFVRSGSWISFEGGVAKELLAFGSQAHIGTMSPVDTLRIDQLLLGLFLAPAALGTYVVGMTFVTANRLLGTSLGMVSFAIASKRAQIDRYNLLLRNLLLATAVLAVGLTGIEILLGRDILRILFAVQDPEAYEVLVVLSIASVAMNLRQISSDICRGFGMPRLPSVAEITMALSLVVLAFLLWGRGLVGVSIAVAISSFIALLVVLAGLRLGKNRQERFASQMINNNMGRVVG